MKHTIRYCLPLISLIACGVAFAKEKPASPNPIGQEAVSIADLSYVKGDPVTFENDHVYILELWATWCGPCKMVSPWLTKVQEKYKDKNVTVIGITREKDLEKVKAFVAKQGDRMGYTVAADLSGEVVGHYERTFKVDGIPWACVVDGAGAVSWQGYPVPQNLEKAVEAAFKNPGQAAVNPEQAPAEPAPAPGKPAVVFTGDEDEFYVDVPLSTNAWRNLGILPPAPAKIGDKAGSLKGLTHYIKGDPVTITEGRVYVVDFWATWCAPCLASIPRLTELQRKHKDVTVIGISLEKELDKVKELVEAKGDTMQYTVAVDLEGDVAKRYMKAYRQMALPALFIVDKSGKMVWHGNSSAKAADVVEKVLDGSYSTDALVQRLAAERETSALWTAYFNLLKKHEPIEKTRPVAEKFLKVATSSAMDVPDGDLHTGSIYMNNLAWNILKIYIPSDCRDNEIALELARAALAKDTTSRPAIYGTFARALFQTGKIDEAVEQQEKAVELCRAETPFSSILPDLQQDLERFKSAQKGKGDD